MQTQAWKSILMALSRLREQWPLPVRSRAIWSGVYGSVAQVPRRGPGFDGDTWLRMVAESTRRVLKGERSDDHALLALLVATMEKPVHIVDFGGAMGSAYLHLRAAVPRAEISYTVVEKRRLGHVGRSIVPEVNFTETLPSGPPDIIYVRSVIQYTEDPITTLRALFGCRPKYVLLVDLFAGSIPTFATAQLNHPGSVIPFWFLSISDVLAASEEYRLLLHAPSRRKIVGLDVPPRYRLDRSRDLLFAR